MRPTTARHIPYTYTKSSCRWQQVARQGGKQQYNRAATSKTRYVQIIPDTKEYNIQRFAQDLQLPLLFPVGGHEVTEDTCQRAQGQQAGVLSPAYIP